jgi:hypothetical protein
VEPDDLEDMDLKELDLQGITTTWEQKEKHSILDQKIRLLQTALIKSRNKEKGTMTRKGKNIGTASLGIKYISSKWIIKAPKDDKIRGRPSNNKLL